MPVRHARSETRGRPPCGRRGGIGNSGPREPTTALEAVRRSACSRYLANGDQRREVLLHALSVVLALAVRVVLRLCEDDGSVLPRALAVPLGILDPDLNDM